MLFFTCSTPDGESVGDSGGNGGSLGGGGSSSNANLFNTKRE